MLPPLEQRFHLKADVIAIGNGEAFTLAENGDVVLSHAPEPEQAFVNAGFDINRREVMYNDFILFILVVTSITRHSYEDLGLNIGTPAWLTLTSAAIPVLG